MNIPATQRWLAKQLVRWHAVLLLVAVLIAAAGWPMSRQLSLDWAVEGMFPPGDPAVIGYRQLQERFGGNDICLAVYRDPQLWSEDGAGLDRLSGVCERVKKVPGVQAVLSLAELHRILERIRGPLQFFGGGKKRSALLDPDDEFAQAFAEVFEGYTHHRSSDYVAIACLLNPADEEVVGPLNYQQTLAELEHILSELPEPATEGFVTGEPVLVAEGFKMVQRDGVRLGVTSSLLVSIVLLICFRSVRWTLVPLAIVHWSLLFTQAILVLCRLELTMISSTLTAIVTVIGVATSMHLLLRFQQARREGLSRTEAMETTLSVLLVPVFWACVTDAVGFLALMIADVGPVRDFGLMMAIGSGSVFVAIVLLVPGLALVGSWDTDPRTPRLDSLLREFLQKVLEICLARRRIGIAVIAGLLLFAVVGSMRVEVETEFTKNFKPNSPIVRGYATIERELGGAGVWDVMVPTPVRITSDYVDQVALLEDELRDISVRDTEQSIELTKVLSVVDAVRATETMTMLAAVPVGTRLQGMRASMPEFTNALLTREADEGGSRWLRIMLRSQEQAPAALKSELVRAVQNTLSEFVESPGWKSQFESEPATASLAGYHVMLSKLVDSVLRDQWRCFAAATVGMFLLMVVATRSWGLALATLVPNALPILLVLAVLGWSGGKANMGVAMIASVSLGLSIDSSIHYLLHYQRKIRSGLTPNEALMSAQSNVGLAAVLATVALVAGFASLCLSEFVPTVVFGTLASLTMLGALIGNLLLLPLLIAPRATKSANA
ncbi:MAG: MMPL family transporter [Planctomycetota bacterium]